MQIVMGVLRLSLGVKVLHGAKIDQILYNTLMSVLGLKIGLMEYVLSYLKVLHNISVNARPSSCIYKIFQSSDYEIGDCFYDEGITRRRAFNL
jgi:hypothetical protein